MENQLNEDMLVTPRDVSAGEDNQFNLSLRLLGNEVIGVTLSANNVKNKWLFTGLLSTAVLVFIASEYGPALADFFGKITG